MIPFIYVAVIFCLLLYCKWALKNKLMFTLMAVFLIWWVVIILLSAIYPYADYQVSDKIYTYAMLFILSFTISYTLYGQKNAIKYNMCFNNKTDGLIKEEFLKFFNNNKILLVLIIVSDFILALYAYRYFELINVYGMEEARNIRFYVGPLFTSTFEILFYNYIICAIQYLNIFVICYALLFNRTKSLIFFVSLAGFILYSLIGSGRFSFVIFLVNYLMLFVVRKTCFKIKNKTTISKKIIMLCIIGAIIIAMTYMTAYRRGLAPFEEGSFRIGFELLMDQTISYNSAPLAALTVLDETDLLTNHMYFLTTSLFNGVQEVAIYIFNAVGIPIHNPKFGLAELANQGVQIGDSYFNALYSAIFWFYSDFGIFGILICSGLFGIFYRWATNRLIANPTIFNLMLLIHISYFVIISNMKWEINSVSSMLYIVCLLLMNRYLNNGLKWKLEK